jgi:hypothetical protein
VTEPIITSQMPKLNRAFLTVQRNMRDHSTADVGVDAQQAGKKQKF